MAKMKAHHYTGIARCIRDCGGSVTRLVHLLADFFAGENPSFEREKFLKDAGR